MIIIQSEVESFLDIYHSIIVIQYSAPQNLGRTGPQYRRRYDMGEVNTNGYRVHDDLNFSARLLRAILAGIAASILVFRVLVGVFLVGL